MPSRGSIVVMFLILLGILPSNMAHAGILPCTGETLTKVLDIPNLTGADIGTSEDLADRRIALGYLFKGCTDGEWVAHLGPQGGYRQLSEEQLNLMVAAAGLDALPAPPGFWSSEAGQPILLLLVLLTGLGLAGAVMARRMLASAENEKASWGHFVEDAALAYHAPPSPPAGYRPGPVREHAPEPDARHASRSAGAARAGTFGRRPTR